MMDVIHMRIQLALCLVMLTTGASAFQTTSRLQLTRATHTTTSIRMAAIDPNEIANAASSIHHHTDLHSWDAILSTLYSTTVDGVLKPAHGHSQPLFGPPDQYLTSGHSIAPALKNLDITPGPTDKLPEIAQAAIEKGKKVVDASKFQSGGGATLPGFKETGGILPRHVEGIPNASMQSFQAQFINSVRSFKILEKIPEAAFVYVLIDFFFLRPNVDLYKEDIEEEPLEVAVETVAVTGVRLGVMFLIGLITVVVFG